MDSHEQPAPPPRPLRIQRSSPHQTPDGPVFVHDEVIVRPGDPEYEIEYAQALHAYHLSGQAMPYADRENPEGVEAALVADHQPGAARRALWIPVLVRQPGGTSPELRAAGRRVMEPDDPDYERHYQQALAEHRWSGTPMPYADEGED